MSVGPVVVVHGGAGEVPVASWQAHRDGCLRAASAGLEAMERGGSALDAVELAVRLLEDEPQYNAGTGACLTADGLIELDAAIMDGSMLAAGAVAAMPPFKNPIAVARAVLKESRHVLYVGEGAARFAVANGFSPSSHEAMTTSTARARLAEVLATGGGGGWAGGTVGAVACDGGGHVAAATSTGGMIGKHAGRVGDSLILGAGTYADDEAAAASATGHGEAALRLGLTRHACDRVRAGSPAQAAADEVIRAFGARVRGSGGLILVTPRGEVGIAWNTATMTHAVAQRGQTPWSAISR